jgi:hypothetical protein
MRSAILKKVAIIAMLILIPSVGLADESALSFSGGTTYSWPGATIGWEFTISAPITVTALGVWDENGDGLSEDHQVGIWASTGGAPLVSTSVTTTNPLIDGFRYNTISDYQLAPGTYVVGAYMPPTGSDLGTSGAVYTTNSPVTYIRNLYLYDAGFTIPTVEWVGQDGGNFGGNFRFRSTQSQPIPTLSEWGMIIMSLILAGSAIWMIRRRQVA